MEINYEKIGKEIYTRRKIKGITQETLAERINSSPVYISEIENGRKKASLKVLFGIAKALDSTIDELMNSDEIKNNYTREMINAMEDCSENEKKILCNNMISLKHILRNNK